jgi:hypothetical protein
VNEYTRREEVRGILVSAVALVGCVACALGLLLTARPTIVPDAAAREHADKLTARMTDVAKCPDSVKLLRKELGVFREVGKASGIMDPPQPPPEEPTGKPGPKPAPGAQKKQPKPPELAAPPWPAAKPTYERSKAVLACKLAAAEIVSADGPAEEAWKAIEKVASLKAPADSDDAAAQKEAARGVFEALDKAPLDALEAHLQRALDVASTNANEAKAKAEGAVVEQPLARGLLGREVAVATGVLLSLIALLVSFFSLRATSARRGSSLASYRKATRPPERGLQAAMILRLASEPNGGEPGLVYGAGIGGVAAAGLMRSDADWYVAGVTAGLLLGLLAQTVIRRLAGPGQFRDRALALAEIEKPVVPIVLVLSTIQPGREDEFLDFFLKLSPTEAANAVEKLAHQAEEQILIAADAQALG